tara:strand:- start:475 stop:1359 length:885 start_codon:yes stop_codon:yes gene_type:complete
MSIEQERNNFKQNHPDLLGDKHSNTIQSIKDLQEIEKYMFKNLQNLNRSSEDSVEKSEIIKNRLNELASMRMSLFNNMKTMYSDHQRQTSDSRSNLADQITMTNVIDNELNNAKEKLNALKKEKANKKRLTELGQYEYDRYRAHKNIMKVIAYGSLGILLIILLMRNDWFPASIGFISISLLIVIIIITIMGRILNNFSRSNLNWNKFNYDGYPGQGGEGPKKEFDFNSLFSTTCKNIEDSLKSGKDTLKNTLKDIKNRSDATGKLNVIVEGESFQNLVNPSQPKGHEQFQTIH